jgi:hypothetical protein
MLFYYVFPPLKRRATTNRPAAHPSKPTPGSPGTPPARDWIFPWHGDVPSNVVFPQRCAVPNPKRLDAVRRSRRPKREGEGSAPLLQEENDSEPRDQRSRFLASRDEAAASAGEFLVANASEICE